MVSEKLRRQGSQLILNNTNCYPHISLYHFNVMDEHLQNVISAIKLAKPLRLTAIQFYSYPDGPSEGFVDVEYRQTTDLIRAQAAIVEICRAYEADSESNPYTTLGNSFRPHLTLGKMPHYNAGVVQSLTGLDEFNDISSSLAVFRLGEHGTCVENIARI